VITSLTAGDIALVFGISALVGFATAMTVYLWSKRGGS
jgi:hypothetical protein